MKEFLKSNKALLLSLLVVAVLYGIYKCTNDSNTSVVKEKIEYVDDTGTYHKLYDENDFNKLKKENKALYDSLKKYKDEITYLIQFKVKNDYSTGKVIVNEELDSTIESHTYEYTNEPNDTMRYNLKINSVSEPNWYSLDITTNAQYTIVNKTYDDGTNHITIDGDGEISDATIFKKKEKRKLWDRFSFGPGITVGYDPIRGNMGVVVGVSATFDLK